MDLPPPNASNDLAELSSVASVTTEMKARVTDVAERYQAVERMDIAGDLFEVERAMRTAERRLARVMRALR